MKDNEDYLGARSPYIKNNTLGLHKTRKNILSFTEGLPISSDTLLYKKISNISRGVVGTEIKKFAEVASKEITAEFSNLSKQLEQNIQYTFKESIKKEIKDNIKVFEKNIGEDIEIQIEKLNQAILNIENKLKNRPTTLEFLGVVGMMSIISIFLVVVGYGLFEGLMNMM